MRLEHVALWTPDPERLRAYYAAWFGAEAGAPYHNPRTGFRSYFLRFADGARLELMQRPDIAARPSDSDRETHGYAHLAITVGDEAAVDALTERMRAAGVPVISGPRRTGDGYYESVVLDPDGNRIELVA